MLLQVSGSFQTSSTLLESRYDLRPDSSTMLRSPVPNADVSSWKNNSVQAIDMSHGTKGLVLTHLDFTNINIFSSHWDV